ncbi:MAG: hypothetical protein ACSW8C_01390 [bacterium]
MRKQQISFSVESFIVDALKKEASMRKMSISEFVREIMLRVVLKNSPDLIGLTDPETGKICEILKRKGDPELFDDIKNPDRQKTKKYSSLEEFEKDLAKENV